MGGAARMPAWPRSAGMPGLRAGADVTRERVSERGCMSGLVVFAVDHPHPDPAHVMRAYRGYLVGTKRKWMANNRGPRCLRALIHYQKLIQTYLYCKQLTLSEETNGG